MMRRLRHLMLKGDQCALKVCADSSAGALQEVFARGIVRDVLFIGLLSQQNERLRRIQRGGREVVAHNAPVHAQIVAVAIYSDDTA